MTITERDPTHTLAPPWTQRYITGYPMMTSHWIVECDGLDGLRYTITGRGSRALQVYSAPLEPRRYDGICPRCGQRPRRVVNGNIQGWCLPCSRKSKRRQNQLFGYPRSNPNRLCPACKTRKVHSPASGGRPRPYCQECAKAKRRGEKKRLQRKMLQQIADGKVFLCIKCKDRPRHHTENTVYVYCQPCLTQYMRAYNQAYAEKRRLKETNHD